MKLVNLATIESAFARRVALVLHLPVAAAVLALHVVEGAVNVVRNFTVNTTTNVVNAVIGVFHNVANVGVGLVAEVSRAVQDFVDHVVSGFRTVGADLAYVWSGSMLSDVAKALPVTQPIAQGTQLVAASPEGVTVRS